MSWGREQVFLVCEPLFRAQGLGGGGLCPFVVSNLGIIINLIRIIRINKSSLEERFLILY